MHALLWSNTGSSIYVFLFCVSNLAVVVCSYGYGCMLYIDDTHTVYRFVCVCPYLQKFE